MAPNGSGKFKTLLLLQLFFSNQNVFSMFLVTILTMLPIGILKFQIYFSFKKRLKFNIVPMAKNGKWPVVERKGVKFGTVGSLGSICAISGILASGQVSCPNKAILKIAPYL